MVVREVLAMADGIGLAVSLEAKFITHRALAALLSEALLALPGRVPSSSSSVAVAKNSLKARVYAVPGAN